MHYAVDALASLTISNVTVTNNRTEVNSANPASNGGGIAAFQGSYNFTNLTVMSNITAFATDGCTNCAGEGGGLLVSGGNTANPTSLSMTNCTITGNDARTATTFGERGGGVYTSSDSTSISGGTYNSNIAAFDGGGAIYQHRGVLNLNGLTIGGTGAGEPNTAFNGGGIGHSYAQNTSASSNAATLNINGGSIVGNVGNNDGGGVLMATLRNFPRVARSIRRRRLRRKQVLPGSREVRFPIRKLPPCLILIRLQIP